MPDTTYVYRAITNLIEEAGDRAVRTRKNVTKRLEVGQLPSSHELEHLHRAHHRHTLYTTLAERLVNEETVINVAKAYRDQLVKRVLNDGWGTSTSAFANANNDLLREVTCEVINDLEYLAS